MDKLILRKIAKDWCKAIIKANDGASFVDMEELLSQDEQDYIIEECDKIAERITSDTTETNLEDIVKKYYEV